MNDKETLLSEIRSRFPDKPLNGHSEWQAISYFFAENSDASNLYYKSSEELTMDDFDRHYWAIYDAPPIIFQYFIKIHLQASLKSGVLASEMMEQIIPGGKPGKVARHQLDNRQIDLIYKVRDILGN